MLVMKPGSLFLILSFLKDSNHFLNLNSCLHAAIGGNVPAITVVADFKVHHYQVARKLQKSCEPLKTTSPGNYR